MSDKPCVYAYPAGLVGDYDPYLRFTQDNQRGDLIVTARGVGRDQATLVIPFEEVRTMVAVLYDYQLLHRLGAFVKNAQTFIVFVNGRAHLIPDDTLTYDQIVGLAAERPGASVIAMRNDGTAGFTVRKGGSVTLCPGMRFEVAFTGSA